MDHIYLITDTFFAENILINTLERLPKDMPIWMMPSQSIGFPPEHQAFPGTLSLSADVLLSMVTDVGQQIASMGFNRLVFLMLMVGKLVYSRRFQDSSESNALL